MHCSATVLLFLLLVPAAVRGQSPVEPVTRADVAISTGWVAENRSIDDGSCCSSWSSGLFKGVSAGYYWTDHLKTEAGVGDPGTTEAYGTVTERLRELAISSWQILNEHRQLMVVGHRHLGAARMRTRHDSALASVERLIAQGQKTGELRTDAPRA